MISLRETKWRIYHRHYQKEVGQLTAGPFTDAAGAVATFMEIRVASGLPCTYLPSDLVALREVVLITHDEGEA